MKRALVLAAVLVAVVSMFGAMPAQATHNCTNPSCNPVSVAVFEGIGKVCNLAAQGGSCSYTRDILWSGSTNATQGLYWPGVGPPATGPFSFSAGPLLNPPGSICASSVGGLGCTLTSQGQLFPGEPSGSGAYCGSSKGTGTTNFTAGDGSLTTVATFGWDQSAGTILPLQGRVTSSNPAGGAGATVIGFTSSRGVSGGGNCGITDATTQFQVEGMFVTF